MNQEVSQPILNSPFAAPARHWYIREGEQPELRDGRRPAIVYPPREERKDRRVPWNLNDGTLAPSNDYAPGLELTLVNLIRERVAAWRDTGYAGVTRTTHDLLTWWRREGREKRLFFAQLEAAETILFLNEARADFRQGIAVPRDEPSDDRRADGFAGFLRYACKMATGSGKTTVMGMLAAWSILNKVNNRGDARFSDVVLIVCPNVTIRNRLQELDPLNGEASLYRTRDLVPPHLMEQLSQGRVLVTNWHVFAPQTPNTGDPARVVKAGVAVKSVETIQIGPKSTTARGSRYLTLDDYQRQVAAGLLQVLANGEELDSAGNLKRVKVESTRYVESDTSLLNRVLGREVGGKQNILVMNDEAHHAYRIKQSEPDENEDETLGDDADDYFQEATVWIDGLDKIHKQRGINFCVDLSATPYFLGRVGQETNRPFPWVISDFGLVDAIESGLVKIPQLAVRDTTGAAIPGYFNVWHWILPQLTSAERGGKRSDPKPEAILKYADHPIRMLGGLWDELRQQLASKNEDPRPPVFILVCKNTKLAKVMYDWLADDVRPTNIPPAKLDGFRNRDGTAHTIRVDSKVVFDSITDGAKSDEQRWMRFTLDTVGKLDWPRDRQGRELYPDDFEDLAKKLDRPLHPPGRDVRCIVSVAMLTEGWDCNTVTHVVGLRPFLSQLLCEQVVGRALRRFDYEVDESTGLLREEVAKVFGVPFEIIPMKANPQGPTPPPPQRRHVHAVPQKSQFEIQFPRVEGYTQAVRNRIAIDWSQVPPLHLLPGSIPPEVEVKGLNVNNVGRLSLAGPGKLDDVRLQTFRDQHRLQELVFDLAGALTREYLALNTCECPAHALFPQLAAVVRYFVEKKVVAYPPTDKKDLFLAPYYGWAVERLRDAIRPDASSGEIPEVPIYETHRGPGTTAEVDFWTGRDVREVTKSHLNYIVADTKKWEQSAAYYLDKSELVSAFVKNAGLGFAIPYFHNGQPHEYVPDFVARLNSQTPRHLILETKGYDPLEEIKRAAALRWIAAVNADGQHGRWAYEVVKKPESIPTLLAEWNRTS